MTFVPMAALLLVSVSCATDDTSCHADANGITGPKFIMHLSLIILT